MGNLGLKLNRLGQLDQARSFPSSRTVWVKPSRGVILLVALLAVVLDGIAAQGLVLEGTQQQLDLDLVGYIGGQANAIDVHGNHAYVVFGSRLIILDITDAQHPSVVGQSALMPGDATDMVVDGSYAYTVDGDGLRIGVAYEAAGLGRADGRVLEVRRRMGVKLDEEIVGHGIDGGLAEHAAEHRCGG